MAKFQYSDLLDRKLVSVKAYRDSELKVIKYSKRVFYDALWNEDPRLLEARGLVLDSENNIVSRPMAKIFNYQENGAGSNLSRDMMVFAAKKMNGFLICATESANHGMVVHTTGTLDSDFVKLGKQWLEKTESALAMVRSHPGMTFMFEVCDPSDPHIVKERPGLYLLAVRDVESGHDLHWNNVFKMANRFQVETPEGRVCRFGDVIADLKTIRHEGWIVRGLDGEYLLKGKSKYYLVTKFLARNNRVLDTILTDTNAARKIVDEEYYDLVRWLSENVGMKFKEFNEQERIRCVESYFEDVTS